MGIHKMGNHSCHVPAEKLERIVGDTGLRKPQVENLYQRFVSLDGAGKGYLVRHDFSELPELQINPLRGRILDMFFEHRKTVTFYRFCVVLSCFKKDHTGNDEDVEVSQQSRLQKLQFLYKMYDKNADGALSATEFSSLLRAML